MVLEGYGLWRDQTNPGEREDVVQQHCSVRGEGSGKDQLDRESNILRPVAPGSTVDADRREYLVRYIRFGREAAGM